MEDNESEESIRFHLGIRQKAFAGIKMLNIVTILQCQGNKIFNVRGSKIIRPVQCISYNIIFRD